MFPEQINTMYRDVCDKYEKIYEYKRLRRDQFSLMRSKLGFDEYSNGLLENKAKLNEQLDYVSEQTEEYAKIYNEAMEARRELGRMLRSLGFCDDIVNSILTDIGAYRRFFN